MQVAIRGILRNDTCNALNYLTITMKTAHYLLFFGLLIFASSCSGVRGMRVQVQRPAEITVSKNIQSVAILNRSLQSAPVTAETVLTGERKTQDKELSRECIRGLSDLLRTSERFKIKVCEGDLPSADPRSLSFAGMLDWNMVDSICKKYEVEALLVLEYFDTDFSVVNPGATAAAAVTNLLNGNNAEVEVTGTAKATAGWRMYVPATQSVIYENYFSWKKIWRERSTNPIDAAARLIKPNQALMDVSWATGNEFGMRIVPLYYWENRSMYKGKKGDMERGERQALAKDWEGAIETWKIAYDASMKSKVRAKAAFNLALAYEVMGDLKMAQKWVQTSYVERDTEEALRYGDILDQRIREQDRLQEQIENGSENK